MLKKAIGFACWGNMPQSVRRVARLVMDINPSWKPPGPFSSTVYRPGSRTTLPRGQPEVWLSCAKRALAARLPMQGVPTSARGCCPISGGGWDHTDPEAAVFKVVYFPGLTVYENATSPCRCSG